MSRVDVEPLFRPFQLRNIVLPNRFVMPAMQRGWCENGAPSRKMAAYYAERVKGGVGLVISEACAIDHPAAVNQPGAAHIFGPATEAWRACVSAVKSVGGQMLIQLWHEGGIRKDGDVDGHSIHPSVSPSGRYARDKTNGRAATLADLRDIKAAFVRGALAAREIGAAGVEIHSAHGYLMDLFLWPDTNLRTDEYGGGITGRARFPAEVVAAIRHAVGDDFVISYRISQWKEVDFDARIAADPCELEILLRLLRGAGVDVFHVSTRRFDTPEWPNSDRSFSGWARSLTDAPVIAIGGVGIEPKELPSDSPYASTTEASLATLVQRFETGHFDLVAVGRCQIGDAAWVNKVRAGAFAEIRPFTRKEVFDEHEWDRDFVIAAHGTDIFKTI